MKLFYFALAWLFFALGIAGVLLPVLPTTPFMILALWSFSRSSDRFHHWLYHHRVFGPALQRWQQHRIIPWSAKIFSALMMSGSYLYLLLFKSLPLYLMLCIALVMGYGLWFILSKPSRIAETASIDG